MQWPSERLLRVSREAFWIALGQFVAAVGLIVGVRLLTAVLPPAGYGQLALGMTIAVLVQQTILGPIANAGVRFFAAAHERGEIAEFLRHLFRLLNWGSLALIAGAAVAAVVCLAVGAAGWAVMALSAVAFAVVTGYSSAVDGMQNAARQRVIVAWHNAIAPWLRFAAAVLLVRMVAPAGAVAMTGYVLASAIVLGSQALFFRRFVADVSQTAVASEWRNRIIEYAWPFGTWGIFTWVQMSSDRWALQAFSTTQAVGLYAVLYQLGYYPLLLVSGWVTQVAAPVVFSRAGVGSDPARVRSSTRLTWLLVAILGACTAIATLVAAGWHRQVFALVTGPQYRAVSYLLPWAVLAGGLFACAQLAQYGVLSGRGARAMLAPKIATAAVGATANIVGAWLWQIPGVVMANVVFSLLYFGWIAALLLYADHHSSEQTGLTDNVETSQRPR